MKSYKGGASAEFWENFPSNPIPKTVISKIDHKAVGNLLKQRKHKLTPCEISRAEKFIESLKKGAPSFQKVSLPSCNEKNAPSSFENGIEITDSVAFWLTEKYACGPFDNPPLSRFRVNSLMAMPQDGKVRAVLNVSRPAGASFNENVKEFEMEKVKMSSARNFGYSIKSCGKNAIMSKFDFTNAYKNVPCNLADLRLQGFKWLDKFFLESTQIFGARTSVANFDIMGNTVVALTLCDSMIHPKLVHRHLDDVPVVAPEKTQLCQDFSANYRENCKKMNIGLAKDCPAKEKAFCNVTEGKVLGIWFDTSDLSWSLPKDKKDKTLRKIYDAIKSEFITVLQMQKLMGHLNNVSMLCPFLNGFRGNLNHDLGISLSSNFEIVKLSVQSKNDLNVWTGCILDECDKLPIPSCPTDPPLMCKCFTSDAAGWADSVDVNVNPGVASVGLSEDGCIMYATQRFWNFEMISKKTDCDGKRFGNKTAFLEFCGIIIPFIAIPCKLKNQHIVMKVDNISCHYAWQNKYMKEDMYTSILIRSLHVISNFLGSIVHVEHLPRKTSWESCLADRLSRRKTTLWNDKKLVDSYGKTKIPKFFSDWLDKPTVNWDIPMMLLNVVENEINKK